MIGCMMHIVRSLEKVANQSSESSFVLRHLNSCFDILIAVLFYLLYDTSPDMHILRLLPKASGSRPRSLDGYLYEGRWRLPQQCPFYSYAAHRGRPC